MKFRETLHKGWILPPVCLFMIMSSCFFSTGMSITLAGIRSTYGLSATSTASITMVRSLVALAAILFSDKFFEITGLRKGMSITMLIGSLACVIFSVGNGRIGVYYIAAAISGITYAYGLIFAVSILLKRWFTEKRGLAMSIASSGTGLTSIIWAPIIQKVIIDYGMKTAFLIEGGVMLFSALLVYIAVVDYPSDIGLEPVGGVAKTEVNDGKKGCVELPVLSKKNSVLLIFAVALIAATASPAAAHLSLNYTHNGTSPMTVAKAISIYGFVLIVAKLILGAVQDRFGGLITMLIFGTIHIAADIMIGIGGMSVPSPAFIFVTFIVFGMGVPCETLGYPNWCADLTSPSDYPALLKKVQLGYQIGGLVFTTVPGIICDLTGSYGWFFILSALLLLISFLIIFVEYRIVYKTEN